MPAINFSPQFADAVEAGAKRQTIRKVRKNPIEYGDTLYLYTGQRTKSCRKLGEWECSNTRKIVIHKSSVWLDGVLLNLRDTFVLVDDDGFDNMTDFFDWFVDHYGPHFEGVLISW